MLLKLMLSTDDCGLITGGLNDVQVLLVKTSPVSNNSCDLDFMCTRRHFNCFS